jgi:Nif-specific regulatory protein
MLLADYFIEKYGKEQGRQISSISTTATDMLMKYHWPGNVRELENCMERAIILSTDGVIHSYHLPRNLQTSDVVVRPEPEGGSFNAVVGNVEREIIIEELKNSRGNMAQAARALGLTERVMGLRIVKYAIDPRQFK